MANPINEINATSLEGTTFLPPVSAKWQEWTFIDTVLVYFCQMGTELGLISSSCQIIHLGAIQLSVYLHKIAICVDILLRGLPFSYLETHIPSMERANERGPCGNACVRNEFPDE